MKLNLRSISFQRELVFIEKIPIMLDAISKLPYGAGRLLRTD